MANITSITDLKQMAEGEVIELPRFREDIPFNAKVKKVSLLNLIKNGTIPNSLLSAAEELFYGKKASKNVDMAQMSNVMIVMAENTLVEPTIEDIKSVGLELSDEQLVALFNYTQKGIKAVTPIPTESQDNVSAGNGDSEQSETEPDNQSN